MDLPVLTIAVTAIVAGFVQGVAGFAMGIILMLVLPGIFGVLNAGALCQFVSFFVCGFVAFMYRRHLAWKVCAKICLIYFPFFYLIHHFGKNADASVLRPLLGIVLMLIALPGSFLAKRIRIRPTWKAAAVCTALSAGLDAFFGIGGPPMVMLILASTGSHEEYLATIQASFALCSLGATLIRFLNSSFPPGLLPAAGVLLPALAAGTLLARPLVRRITREKSAPLVYAAIGIAGLITFASSVLSY